MYSCKKKHLAQFCYGEGMELNERPSDIFNNYLPEYFLEIALAMGWNAKYGEKTKEFMPKAASGI